jgi:adenine-specific DNA-methyltransferase
MRYIGSKAASLQFIERALSRSVQKYSSFCDPFAGTCTVSRHFKSLGYQIYTGDILNLSYALQVAYIEMNRRPSFKSLLPHLSGAERGSALDSISAVLNHLNALPGLDGFITRTYSPSGQARRKFFSTKNAQRIDAVRSEIAVWNDKGWLSRKEFCYLLSSLLHAADQVANTAGTYYAYLKRFYRKARKHLQLQPLRIASNSKPNEARLIDAGELVSRVDADILYLDPPYNSREYAAYYHLPETLVNWDYPEVHGKSGITSHQTRSPFCHSGTATDALRDLVATATSRCILLHYAMDGLISHRDILNVLRSRGSTRVLDWSVRRYLSTSTKTETSYVGQRLYICTVK